MLVDRDKLIRTAECVDEDLKQQNDSARALPLAEQRANAIRRRCQKQQYKEEEEAGKSPFPRREASLKRQKIRIGGLCLEKLEHLLCFGHLAELTGRVKRTA